MEPVFFTFLIGKLPDYIQPWLAVAALLCVLQVLMIQLACPKLHTDSEPFALYCRPGARAAPVLSFAGYLLKNL